MAKQKEQNPVEIALARLAAEANGQALIPEYDPEFSASFPNLWAFLTWREVGDVEKDPGTLSIGVSGTGWKVSYYDPGAEKGCAVLAQTLMDGLRRLDQAVVSPDTLWTGGRRKTGFRRRQKPV